VAVPWIQAFIWAFKPTDIVDIRRFPDQEAKAVDKDIARLMGKAPTVAQPDGPKPDAKPAPDSNPPN
jgi:hypothetical protein